MRYILTIVFALFTLAGFGQTVSLEWKIGEKEMLQYLTVMSDIDTSKVSLDFSGLAKAFGDSTGKGLSKGKDFFDKLNQSFQNIDLVSTLTNKGNGIIDIAMTTRPKEKSESTAKDSTESSEEAVLKMMQSMNQGVMLRGSVYAKGGVHSFWVKAQQKNLIAILFELPTHPVKVGDTWSLDVNLIGNDQNFQCDSSYKINKVTLTELKKVKGETIATLKYELEEYVNGTFSTPFSKGSGEGEPTMMRFSHLGFAEFSVDRGRWVSYNAIMSIDATGVLRSRKKTKFSLMTETPGKGE